MRRLSGFDAQFVYHERPAETQHTLKLAFLEPPSGLRVSPEVMHKAVMARLSHMTPFCWRLARVPFNLHHPVWVTDPDIALGVERAVRANARRDERRDKADVESKVAER